MFLPSALVISLGPLPVPPIPLPEEKFVVEKSENADPETERLFRLLLEEVNRNNLVPIPLKK